jgi:hypothetical protein
MVSSEFALLLLTKIPEWKVWSQFVVRRMSRGINCFTNIDDDLG